MELNCECIRKTLLFIEDRYKLGSFLRLKDFLNSSELSTFSEDEIKYTLLKLYEAHLIEGTPMYGNNRLADFSCGGLTWDGNQFLNNIRDDGIWKKTKKVLAKISGVSIPIISSVASEIIKKKLGI